MSSIKMFSIIQNAEKQDRHFEMMGDHTHRVRLPAFYKKFMHQNIYIFLVAQCFKGKNA